MFCPRCSQSQISDEVRFCSRCGFPLEEVTELLARDGVALIVPDEETKGIVPYLRGKGALVGAKIAFISLFLMAGSFVIALMVNAPAILLLGVIPFILGTAQMLYAIIFGKKPLPDKGKLPPVVQKTSSRFLRSNSAATSELTPASLADEQLLVMPVSKTAEFLTPPSVTDETTKLLKNKQSADD